MRYASELQAHEKKQLQRQAAAASAMASSIQRAPGTVCKPEAEAAVASSSPPDQQASDAATERPAGSACAAATPRFLDDVTIGSDVDFSIPEPQLRQPDSEHTVPILDVEPKVIWHSAKVQAIYANSWMLVKPNSDHPLWDQPRWVHRGREWQQRRALAPLRRIRAWRRYRWRGIGGGALRLRELSGGGGGGGSGGGGSGGGGSGGGDSGGGGSGGGGSSGGGSGGGSRRGAAAAAACISAALP
ncbi:hypothetical protein JKP88DRAFT_294691 [Tribonema minus]|uniref:Uncharacterized protein n=1 Tax=Tribonema minus TaxID=303371 RepID=A0A835ZF55_9STRA|nr:hypothetical protein JKP88DRAFT_294691 [Tribonema minus]